MRTPRPLTNVHLTWLRRNGHEDFGALTGTDFAALEAIDRCWQLLPLADSSEPILAAVALLASQMQPKCRYLASELIARALDWSDIERLWPIIQAKLDAGVRFEQPTAVAISWRDS